MFHNLLSGVSHWLSVVYVVAQCQGSVSANIHVIYLNIGFPVTDIVLSSQIFTDSLIAAAVVDSADLQGIAAAVIVDSE